MTIEVISKQYFKNKIMQSGPFENNNRSEIKEMMWTFQVDINEVMWRGVGAVSTF